jgi:hypothetical protein
MANTYELQAHIEALLATAPTRANFETDEDYEEERGFWRSRQGRNVALLRTQIGRLEARPDVRAALAPEDSLENAANYLAWAAHLGMAAQLEEEFHDREGEAQDPEFLSDVMRQGAVRQAGSSGESEAELGASKLLDSPSKSLLIEYDTDKCPS